MKRLQVDRGAIRFVLAGANLMCHGLASPMGALEEEVGGECPVELSLSGHNFSCNQRRPYFSRKAINKGIGVNNLHHLNYGLWKVVAAAGSKFNLRRGYSSSHNETKVSGELFRISISGCFSSTAEVDVRDPSCVSLTTFDTLAPVYKQP